VYWQEALSGSIEVAIGIAGFSGIVATLGRQSDGLLRVADQLRIRVLLTASGCAMLFSVAPFIVLDAGVSEIPFWRVGSGVQGTWLMLIVAYRLWMARVSGVSSMFHLKIILPLLLIVLLSQMANAALYGLSWVYVTGVAFQLLIAFVAFSDLLLGRWRDEEDAT
jgi:hypothetical protein